MSYVTLHNHSHYSTLDGLGKVPEIVKRAKDTGAHAVAITDHASLSCLPELMSECKTAGIKPIPGCEFFVVDSAEGAKGEKRIHLSVWAKSWKGVQSILKQLSIANKQFYNRPRITWDQAFDFEDCIVGTACAIGVLSTSDYELRVMQLSAKYFKDFYLEIMPHSFIEDGVDIQKICNDRAVEMGSRLSIPLIATNDSHYVNQDDAYTHDILLAIQTGKSLKDPTRWSFTGDKFYMRTEDEMREAFVALGYLSAESIHDSIQNTGYIASVVNVEMPKFEVHLPSLYDDENAVFTSKIVKGWSNLISTFDLKNHTEKEYMDRLQYEIGVIKRSGFIPYFLIVDDIITWSRSNGIMVGPGRGSSAGSLACYLMGITQVDPLRFGLYFERFLNPERTDLPDIDVDFADDRRDEVFNYIRTKYGTDKVARINTFTYLGPKSAFRDVCRVFDISQFTVNILSKQIEDEESFEKVPEIVRFAKEHPEIVKQAKALSGTIRGNGAHACGIVISSEVLSGISAIERRSGDTEVVNWDKDDSEKFGLLKVDVLGLSTLTILNKAKQFIKERHGIDIEYTAIPIDDVPTLQAFGRGDGIGVFQFENGGMQQLLRDLSCDSFETATNTTALFRPGSLNSGQTSAYVRVAKGDEYEKYDTELLRPILGYTKGILVYQEQIMQIFNKLGGFSWAHADKMRKIIGKKLGKDEFEKHRISFVSGCLANGVEEKISSSLFDKMVEFSAYSFNLSHAVAYTMLSFWSMYIKVNYPVEFFAAQLASSSDDRVSILSREAEKNGITIANPDINLSGNSFAIDDAGRIVPPISIIKGVGVKAVENIIEARGGGVFYSQKDFLERIVKKTCNIKIVKLLNRAGAFESLGDRTEDTEERARDFAELLPTFSSLPSLAKGGGNIDVPALSAELRGSGLCASTAGRKFLMPKFTGASHPSIMIINNAVKGESDLLTNDATKGFMKLLKGVGIAAKDIYYTSPMKCFFDKGGSPSKDCEGKCLEALRREIAAVGPKLIVCYSSTALPLFVGDKSSMTKMHGTIAYDKKFGCYIMFSVSPQYAYYQETAQEKFMEALTTLGGIFS